MSGSLTETLAAIARRRGNSGGQVVSNRMLRYLGVGTHTVRVESVNTSCLETRGYVDLVFGSGGQTHRQRVWVLSKDKTQLGFKLKQLLDGIFGDHRVWLEALDINQAQAFHLLRGMECEITLQAGPGYQIQQSPLGWQAVVGDITVATAQTIDLVRRQAEAKGHKRSWLQLQGVTCGHNNDNNQALNNAIEALRSAASTEPVDVEAHVRRLTAGTTR